MKKALIVSVLVGGIWGNLATPMIQPVGAESRPATKPTTGTVKPEIKPTSKLELLDPGAEPRRELKFRPVANSKQTLTMNMVMSMDMIMGETPLPKTSIPKVLMQIDLNVGAVEPSGDIHYNFAYGDIKAIADKDTPPEMLAAMQKSFSTLKGLSGNAVISNTGQVKSQNLVLPKTMDPTMKQTFSQLTKSMEQLSTRLPLGLVGLGAKWQIHQNLQVAGIQLVQASTYEIVDINERGMTIKTKISQSSPAQDIPIPGVGKEVKSKIISLTSNGEGRYVLKFDSLLPVAGKVSTTTESKMSIQVDPKEPPTNMSSKIGIDLNITGK